MDADDRQTSSRARDYAGPGSGAPLCGRRALVTGSVAGLGRAIAEGLARAGCDVMLTGVEPEGLSPEARAAIAEGSGARVEYTHANLSAPEGVDRLVQATAEAFGGIDVLVNNAVVRHFSPIADLPRADWNEALAINLSAAFYAIQRVLPPMREANYGRIFNITSVYGLRGTPDRVGYITTKAALQGLTRSVAIENLGYDVTCHSICPGSVLTPGTEDRIEALALERNIDRAAAERIFLKGKQPGGNFVATRSVTDLIVFLCGSAARDMTGSLLPVEAGWLIS